jgi:hypothetical protein
MDPATIALIAAAVNAGASIFSGMQAGKQTKGQKRDDNTISQILASINGNGPYSDMFNMDYDAFQKSYVDPAMSQFSNVTAPNIQQQYISSGQQRGTGMEDTLSRAGVDMQQLLNQQYAGMQNSAMDRKFRALQGTLGQGQAGQQSGNKFANSVAGFASSGGGSDFMTQLLNAISNSGNSGNNVNVDKMFDANTSYSDSGDRSQWKGAR